MEAQSGAIAENRDLEGAGDTYWTNQVPPLVITYLRIVTIDLPREPLAADGVRCRHDSVESCGGRLPASKSIELPRECWRKSGAKLPGEVVPETRRR
jgi:hypothetical protein